MCMINCSGGCRECDPQNHIESLLSLLKESLVHLKNLNEYPWSDFPDVIEATKFMDRLGVIINEYESY